MGTCEYRFFFSAFIVLSFVWLDLTQALPRDEEIDKKYIPFEEAILLLKHLTYADANEYSWLITPFINASAVFEPTENPEKALPLNFEEIKDKLKLFVYTRTEPEGVELSLRDMPEMEFDPSKPTKIICHGWMVDPSGKTITKIAEAYLDNGDHNVIAVDWSAYSTDWFYPNAAKATKYVGEYVAEVIDSLVEERKAQYSDFHIIGHSLGAHVAGFAGNSTKEKIGRITGLDPALPGFQYEQGPMGRLDSTDADFVDIIHTCSGVLGISVPTGHVDFFPNGGSPLQPGCMSVNPVTIKSCSHGRSEEYFTESIRNKRAFIGVACEDWNHFVTHTCQQVYAPMGEYVTRDARGIFYLKTKDHHPYGKGENGAVY